MNTCIKCNKEAIFFLRELKTHKKYYFCYNCLLEHIEPNFDIDIIATKKDKNH